MTQKILCAVALAMAFLGGMSGRPILNDAEAAFPPSEYILKTWLAKHKGTKHFRMKSTVVAYEKDQPTQYQFSEVALFQLEGRTVKSWASDSTGRKLYFNESKTNLLPLISKLLSSQDMVDVSNSLRGKRIAIRNSYSQ
jgi:hypothetical protein